MSCVTNVIVSGPARGEAILTAEVPADSKGQYLRELSDAEAGWGGSKLPECNLWAGAFNFLRWEDFREWVMTLPWYDPEHLQVFVMGEGDRCWRTLHASNGVLVEHTGFLIGPARWGEDYEHGALIPPRRTYD
jgi:hypothetical protein